MSQSNTPAGYTVAARSELAGGVEYLKLTRTGPAEVAHVAHVAPGAPVDLRVVNAGDKMPAGPGDLETPSSMCRREHCVVGVNGDFHVNGVPQGGVVAGGRLLHSPDPGLPQLTVTKDGHLVAGPLPWTGSFTFADGTPMALASVNAEPPAGGVALYTPDYGGATPGSARTELLVRSVHGSIAALNQPADVELRSVRSGAGPIPGDGAVLSADGDSAQKLLAAWARKANGAASRARLTVSSPVNAAESLGAYPVVLRDGKRATPWRDPNLVNPRQPHTLVGWNGAGDVYLVAVDGRQAASEGVTMAEAADFLVGLGVTDAVSLDGGGGTTFVTNDAVTNRPSDNDPANPARYTERGATNAFVVLARPAAAPGTQISPLAVSDDGTPPPTKPAAGAGSSPDNAASPTAPIGAGGSAVSGADPVAGTGPVPADATGALAGAGPAAAAASANPGGGQLTQAPDAGTAEAVAAAPARPAAGDSGEARKPSEPRREPLAAASSITTDVVDAVLGEGPAGGAGPAGRTGTGLAAALAVTAVVVRRRRGGRHLPGAEHNPAPPVLRVPIPERAAPPPPAAEPEPVVVFFREVPSESELFIPVAPRPRPAPHRTADSAA